MIWKSHVTYNKASRKGRNGVYNRISAKICFHPFLLLFCILWLPISLRRETFRKLSWPLCDSSYDMFNESSRLDLSEKNTTADIRITWIILTFMATFKEVLKETLTYIRSRNWWKKASVYFTCRGYFGRHFVYISPRDVLAKSSRQYARAPRGMTRFVLYIEILTHIIGTRPDLALTVSYHYGSW